MEHFRKRPLSSSMLFHVRLFPIPYACGAQSGEHRTRPPRQVDLLSCAQRLETLKAAPSSRPDRGDEWSFLFRGSPEGTNKTTTGRSKSNETTKGSKGHLKHLKT